MGVTLLLVLSGAAENLSQLDHFGSMYTKIETN